jgi:hypothetical protein
MLCSQRGHAGQWQVCLAHLLGDARSSVECGDPMFSLPFKWLLLRAIAIGRRREVLNDSTLARYSADLGRRLARVLAGRGIDRTRRLQAAPAHQPLPPAPVRLRDQPCVCGAGDQQRLRPASAAQCGVPQGDQRFPL